MDRRLGDNHTELDGVGGCFSEEQQKVHDFIEGNNQTELELEVARCLSEQQQKVDDFIEGYNHTELNEVGGCLSEERQKVADFMEDNNHSELELEVGGPLSEVLQKVDDIIDSYNNIELDDDGECLSEEQQSVDDSIESNNHSELELEDEQDKEQQKVDDVIEGYNHIELDDVAGCLSEMQQKVDDFIEARRFVGITSPEEIYDLPCTITHVIARDLKFKINSSGHISHWQTHFDKQQNVKERPSFIPKVIGYRIKKAIPSINLSSVAKPLPHTTIKSTITIPSKQLPFNELKETNLEVAHIPQPGSSLNKNLSPGDATFYANKISLHTHGNESKLEDNSSGVNIEDSTDTDAVVQTVSNAPALEPSTSTKIPRKSHLPVTKTTKGKALRNKSKHLVEIEVGKTSYSEDSLPWENAETVVIDVSPVLDNTSQGLGVSKSPRKYRPATRSTTRSTCVAPVGPLKYHYRTSKNKSKTHKANNIDHQSVGPDVRARNIANTHTLDLSANANSPLLREVAIPSMHQKKRKATKRHYGHVPALNTVYDVDEVYYEIEEDDFSDTDNYISRYDESELIPHGGSHLTAHESIAGLSPEPRAGPSWEPQAGSSWEPRPGPSWEPQAGPSWEPQAGPSREPQAGSSREPQAGSSWEPRPGPSWEPQTGSSREPRAGPRRKSCTSLGSYGPCASTSRPPLNPEAALRYPCPYCKTMIYQALMANHMLSTCPTMHPRREVPEVVQSYDKKNHADYHPCISCGKLMHFSVINEHVLRCMEKSLR